MKNEENSFLVITHYKKLLDKLSPSKVHILVDGRIVESGGPDLADKIENKGFESFN
jgi:ABC-type transport system involved in Fe-S cluster assembly, ATPase component